MTIPTVHFNCPHLLSAIQQIELYNCGNRQSGYKLSFCHAEFSEVQRNIWSDSVRYRAPLR